MEEENGKLGEKVRDMIVIEVEKYLKIRDTLKSAYKDGDYLTLEKAVEKVYSELNIFEREEARNKGGVKTQFTPQSSPQKREYGEDYQIKDPHAPASEAQKGLLRKMCVHYHSGVTKIQASELISNAKESQKPKY